jgi:mannosyltransferase OCH1-like enzyme
MPEKYKKIIRFVLIGIIILLFVVPLCVNSFTSYYRYATRHSRRENHVLEPITDDLREEHLIDTKTSIPKVVYLTYHDLNSIPEYVLHNLETYCKGLKIRLFNDDDCREFLSRTIGQQAVDIFNKLELGAHKADFWRYNILYQKGGCYFDIKTKFYTPITKIVDFNSSNTWYGVIGSKHESIKKQIYNGIIVTAPNNPIFGKAVKYIYDNPKPKDYMLFVNQLYDLVQEDCDKPLKVGLNIQKNGWKCILFQENCIKCGGLTGISKGKM